MYSSGASRSARTGKRMQATREAICVPERLEQHRAELTRFCQRMLGASEAEDSEDPVEDRVREGARGHRHVDVLEPERRGQARLVEGPGLHRVANVEDDDPGSLGECFEVLRFGLAPGQYPREGFTGVHDPVQGAEWVRHVRPPS